MLRHSLKAAIDYRVPILATALMALLILLALPMIFNALVYEPLLGSTLIVSLAALVLIVLAVFRPNFRSLEPSRHAALAALSIPDRYGRMLEDDEMTLWDFLKRL